MWRGANVWFESVTLHRSKVVQIFILSQKSMNIDSCEMSNTYIAFILWRIIVYEKNRQSFIYVEDVTEKYQGLLFSKEMYFANRWTNKCTRNENVSLVHRLMTYTLLILIALFVIDCNPTKEITKIKVCGVNGKLETVGSWQISNHPILLFLFYLLYFTSRKVFVN